MAKTQVPATVSIEGVGDFRATAVPDAFDARDLEYRPKLQLLPKVLDKRAEALVLTQEGNSCTGHAVATMINTVIARDWRGRIVKSPARVSPYMLYRLARRYDEFSGEDDIGSSLRGALKGWHRHGVATVDRWPSLKPPEPDLDDPAFIRDANERPLGAYYRVNAQRLDDLQSAISELHAVVASAAVHDGWIRPVAVDKGSEKPLQVIAKPAHPSWLGGHAFALVGYNEVGFLVQNSWGKGWGKDGFATLPYEDWLDDAYDAWVARPGVPHTPFAKPLNTTVSLTGGGLASESGENLARLSRHVVNLTDNGRLSKQGKLTSSPSQVDGIFRQMDVQHAEWESDHRRDHLGVPPPPRRIVLYAHGGLVDEAGGIRTADQQIQWWLNNNVYPVHFAWESGAGTTIMGALKSIFTSRIPAGGIFGDLEEQFDRLVEGLARGSIRPLWNEMKQNAADASVRITSTVDWTAPHLIGDLPGASLVSSRLIRYIASQPEGRVEIHLAGHSAGAIFLASFMERLATDDIVVQSMQLLGGALRVDDFAAKVLPHLNPPPNVPGGRHHLHEVRLFNLGERREQDDKCPGGSVTIYHKSLLYLVARALERSPLGGDFEVPMVGLAKYLDTDIPRVGRTLRSSVDGHAIVSPQSAPGDARSEAVGHGDLDTDRATMTSVLLRILGEKEPSPRREYANNAAPLVAPVSAPVAAPAGPGPGRAVATAVNGAGAGVEAPPAAAGAQPRGPAAAGLPGAAFPAKEVPVRRKTTIRGARNDAFRAVAMNARVRPESGSASIDMLEAAGYRVVADADKKPDKG